MNTGTLSSSQLHALLSTQVSTVRDEDRLTLIGIVRSGSVRDTIEIALNNTGKWVSLPLSMIASAEELGTLAFNGTTMRVMELELKRPKDCAALFDLLAFVLERGALLMPRPSECNCDDGDSQTLPPGAKAKKKKSATKKTAGLFCFGCWVFTGGVSPEFCYPICGA